MAKKAKKNDHESFKTTNQGRKELSTEKMFELLVKVEYGLTLDRADEILDTFHGRVNELAKRGWAEGSTLKTLEIATLENARTMSVNDAQKKFDGCWFQNDEHGNTVQILTEKFELLPPLTKKELDFFNWAISKGEIQLMPIEDGDRTFMIGVINNYPESVILVKP